MGYLLAAECSCGYLEDDIAYGPMMTPFVRFEVASCAHCERVGAVDVSRPRLRCTRCGRKPDLLTGETSPLDTDQSYPCPACLTPGLMFRVTAMAD